MPDEVKNEWRLYANDNKLRGVLEKEDDVIDAQKYIDIMHNWAKTLKTLSFYYDKCKGAQWIEKEGKKHIKWI